MIYTLGAYDRYNYGDLLFPYMLENASSKHLRHLALSSSDLRTIGGRETLALGSVQFSAEDAIIVGGGDVLTANWYGAYWQLQGANLDLPFRVGHKLIPYILRENLSRRLFASNWPTPYVVPFSIAKVLPVAYNSVGGSDLSALPMRSQTVIAESLGLAKYVSVRDKVTLRSLEHAGVHAHLAPDSVAAMAVSSFDSIPKQARIIVIQASAGWMRKCIRRLVPAIDQLAAEGWSVDFIPIGVAGGHSDLDAFHLLSRLCSSVTLVEPTNVEVIRRAIAGATVFAGTSLHGHITAVAAGVPSIVFSGVGKLSSYVDTWTADITTRVDDPSNLSDAVRIALEYPVSQLNEVSDTLGDLARANTTRCMDSIS